MKWSDLVAVRIREVREAKHMTQQDLADAVERVGGDLSRVTLGDIERGKRRVHLDDVATIAAAVNVSLRTLLLPLDFDAQESWESEVDVGELTFDHNDLADWLTGRHAPDPLTGLPWLDTPTEVMLDPRVMQRTQQVESEYRKFLDDETQAEYYAGIADDLYAAARELSSIARVRADFRLPNRHAASLDDYVPYLQEVGSSELGNRVREISHEVVRTPVDQMPDLSPLLDRPLATPPDERDNEGDER